MSWQGRRSRRPLRMPSDWTALAAESLHQTIERVAGLGADDLEQADTIREVVMAELTKLSLKYSTQSQLMPGIVVGFQIEEHVRQLREWVPRWQVSWIDEVRVRPVILQRLFEFDQFEAAQEFATEKMTTKEEVRLCLK